MARLLLLGASNTQLNAIIRAKEKGHTVIVADYLPNAPGRELADQAELVSTFDVQGCLEVARKYKVDGIMTVGTDQPVLTCALVAESLGLPSFLTRDTALAVTNKKVMKSLFQEKGIPSAAYRLIKEKFLPSELQDLKFPVVIKPLDSQGQRGVFKVEDLAEVDRLLPEVLQYSREKEILVEEYYESDEITVSGWVKQDTVFILTVTDRITMTRGSHIGICIAHDFPSRYLPSHFLEIQAITEQIVREFGIQQGPIYFQMLIGSDGIKVNEVACRIGGAYEDELIPLLTGFDILEKVIDFAATGDQSSGIKLGQAESLKEVADQRHRDLIQNKKFASVELFFAEPGKIHKISDMEELKAELSGAISGRFNYQQGMVIPAIENATQRVGYMIFQGDTKEEWRENIRQAYQSIEILDQEQNNLLLDFGRSGV